ncbi:amino acid ABC transporter substrate-binding protein [Idiomarina aminovorans]|uniref:amino acid ABC transporter substrate-binding protein n=1 Tax=Idiomarina aminovorans TaxID=2914829 RepID=UPI002006552A|nr:amino acid ABC transporter substrate-binding protein [Idiomarina sp. ATCH4]MCK7458946.1 amino acid ABC transporter substrate-binding protein [Idiomarina sp. ATCH4]
MLSESASAKIPVYVAAYEHPPYFSGALETDLTRELIRLFNEHQDSYQFLIHVIPPRSRYEALSEGGCCDAIFFESPLWGWSKSGVGYSKTIPLVNGKERLVALKREGIDQSFFKSYEGKTLGGVKGYHYLLGGKLIATNEAKEKYSIYLADSRIINLRMVLGGRVDLTVVNDELLAALQGSHQVRVDNLLLCEKASLEYNLHMLVGNDKSIGAETLQRLMRELGRKGELDTLFKRFNMERFQLYRPSTIR